MQVRYAARESCRTPNLGQVHVTEYLVVGEEYAMGRSRESLNSISKIRGYWFNEDGIVVRDLLEKIRAENAFNKIVTLEDDRLLRARELGKQTTPQRLINLTTEYSQLVEDLFSSAISQILPKLQ